MTRDPNDPLRPLAMIFVVAAAVFLLFALIARYAAADSAPAPAPPPVVAVAFDWKLYLGIAIAAVAGVRTLLADIAAVLRIVAPRTKTPIDDRVLALDEAAREKLDEFIGIAKTLQPPAIPKPVAGAGGAP